MQSEFPKKAQQCANGEVRLKALSLWQPHAQAVALGLKTYETRSWATKYRGPLIICSARKRFSFHDYPAAYYQDVCARIKRAGCPHYALAYGEALCVVDLVDCVPTHTLRGRIGRNAEFWGDFSDGDDDKGRYAFKLENVRRIWPALKVKGRQRWFEVAIPGSNDAFKRTLVAPREPSQRSLEESCTDEQLEGISLK